MKKYEITKEQLKSLIEAAVCNIKDYVMNNDGFIDDWMKDEFPDAFKNELVVGKWYKAIYSSMNFLFYVNEINDTSYKGIGFDNNMNWSDKLDFKISYDYQFTEATPQEVEAALIDEAKKRGFEKGVCCNNSNVHNSKYDNHILLSGNFIFDGGCLFIDEVDARYRIFENGKWATIIKTITIQEAEKLLNKKIV